MLQRLCQILTVTVCLGAAPAQAETRALLIGVADYHLLDADLKGPAADVALMAEVLAARGVTDIRMLASGGSEDPTRAAILAAMDDLTAKAQPGDTVVFYFSGHGAQAPDASGDEGGGYDEILLPADASGWKGSIGAVENALLDDELQAWAQGLLARGVTLVGLLDACHSATGFRAVTGQGAPRGLDAAALGIPDDAPNPPGTEAAALSGAFVFLYSSQSDQRSFEYPLGDGQVWHGAFTLALAETLRGADGASWAQVLRATSDAMAQTPGKQVPDGEGPLLESAVFGTGAATRRFPIEGGRMSAGLLQGLETGAEIAVFAGPSDDQPLGTAVLTKVSAREATVTPPAPAEATWAEVITPAPPRPLTLAPMVTGSAADVGGWAAALAAYPTGPEPDLVPILTDTGLALAGPDGLLDPLGPGSSPRVSLAVGETPDAALARVLEAARHSLNLKRALLASAGRSLTGKPALDLRFDRKASSLAGADCSAPGPAAPVDPATGLAPCDQLWLEVRNISGRTLDVSILYFNADFTVTPIWPRSGLSNRLAQGEKARAGFQIAAGTAPALEELLVVAVPVAEDGARVDLTRLAEPQMNRGFAGAASAVEGWFEDRVEPPDDMVSRGFTARPPAVMITRQVVRVTGG